MLSSYCHMRMGLAVSATLFYFLNILLFIPRPISAVHTHTAVRRFTGAWAAYQWPNFPRKTTLSPNSYQLPTAPRVGVGPHEPLTCPCRDVAWLHLEQVTHKGCELMSIAAMSLPQDSISQLSSVSVRSYLNYVQRWENPLLVQGKLCIIDLQASHFAVK